MIFNYVNNIGCYMFLIFFILLNDKILFKYYIFS